MIIFPESCLKVAAFDLTAAPGRFCRFLSFDQRGRGPRNRLTGSLTWVSGMVLIVPPENRGGSGRPLGSLSNGAVIEVEREITIC